MQHKILMEFVMTQSSTALTESQLHLAVEQLRSQHSNTLDLYKAVAALLFFQYNSTPTTNRMYQLVRKGSMSAPAEALRLFWQELRERSQVRMEQADIPQSLKQSAGSLMAQLWEEGLAQALQMVEQNNQAVYTKIALAEKAQTEALDESKTAQSALLTAQQQLEKQDKIIEDLEKLKQQLQLQVVAQEQKAQSLHEKNAIQQQQHENALLAQKEQIVLSEQRAADMEKYARLEIERVRQESAKTQKQLQNELNEQKQKNQQLQQQLQEEQQNHIALQQKHGYLESKFNDAIAQHKKTEQQNHELRTLLQQLQQQSYSQGKARSPSRLSQIRIKKQQ